MDIKMILHHVDHTLLSQTTTQEEIQILCDEAVHYATASVCLPPCFVKYAKDYVQNDMNVCTVIGFPNGYQTKEVKIFETKTAIAHGADEIDMVINLGYVKGHRLKELNEEIISVRKASEGKTLKIIVETCFLTTPEKISMCEIVSNCGADYIKTSTGFGSSGATFDDIALFRKHIDKHVKIKASGGIRTLEDAQKYLMLGANRLGTSSIVKIAKEMT